MGHSTGQRVGNEEKAGGLTWKQGFATLVALAIGIAVEAVLIHRMSRHGDFLQKGEAWKFALLGITAGSASWIAAACFNRPEIAGQRKAGIFWLIVVVLMLLILPVAPGDDVWRYRWERMIQIHGFNPYRSGPDSPELVALRNADWSKINHRNYPAIYPPLTETIFAAVAAAGNSLWIYKALFALADLAGIAVLRGLLVRSGLGADQAAWYAWNPLAIYASAGAAHFDSLMILALLGAIWAMERCAGPSARLKSPRPVTGISRSCWLGALSLGVAIAIKIAPLALLPVWMFALRSGRRALVLLPVVFAPLGIFALVYGFPGVPVFSTLREFGTGFRVNDPFWWMVDAAVRSNSPGDNVPYGIFGAMTCVALACWFRRDWRRGLLWVWGAALLLSPVVHAWYLVWILPLAAWRGPGARAWFVFSGSIFGYFLLWEVNHASGKPWVEPLWLRAVILLPPLLYLSGTKLIAPRATPWTTRFERLN